jgi:phosphoenolpyruvate synthase/pyruvate phosphate dikinase
MKHDVVPLEKATDTSKFGSKAVGLGDALRAGIPAPPGVALSGDVVEAVASEDKDAIAQVHKAIKDLPTPLAVRSSAADEDGADASFAGQHLTLLNVPTAEDVPEALREIWWSANSDSAITYRKRVGLFTRPSVGVVVQSLLDPEAAGVMFTQNPITGASECLIEASWGLGEAVVAALVIPDNFRVDHSGEVLEKTPGRKQIAIRRKPEGGTFEEEVPAHRVEEFCISDDHLSRLGELGRRCEEIYGKGRDIEWAIADGELYLLQCRAVTAGKSTTATPKTMPSQPAVEHVEKVPLFAGLERHEAQAIARLMKERRFAPGETVVLEGASGAAFFMIDSGEATVTVHGKEVGTLSAGDHFGEIALIDEKPRAATVTAKTDLVCHGLTFWEFRPLVERNGVIGWKLLQSMAGMLREAQRPKEDQEQAAS